MHVIWIKPGFTLPADHGESFELCNLWWSKRFWSYFCSPWWNAIDSIIHQDNLGPDREPFCSTEMLRLSEQFWTVTGQKSYLGAVGDDSHFCWIYLNRFEICFQIAVIIWIYIGNQLIYCVWASNLKRLRGKKHILGQLVMTQTFGWIFLNRFEICYIQNQLIYCAWAHNLKRLQGKNKFLGPLVTHTFGQFHEHEHHWSYQICIIF